MHPLFLMPHRLKAVTMGVEGRAPGKVLVKGSRQGQSDLDHVASDVQHK
jgi:hypothetical protein